MPRLLYRYRTSDRRNCPCSLVSLPPILPFAPTQLLQTPAPFDQQHALGQQSRKWPKTTTFQIRQRQPPQNPLLVKLAPTTILILPNALVTPKARASYKKQQQKNSPPLVPARSTYNLTRSVSLLTILPYSEAAVRLIPSLLPLSLSTNPLATLRARNVLPQRPSLKNFPLVSL